MIAISLPSFILIAYKQHHLKRLAGFPCLRQVRFHPADSVYHGKTEPPSSSYHTEQSHRVLRALKDGHYTLPESMEEISIVHLHAIDRGHPPGLQLRTTVEEFTLDRKTGGRIERVKYEMPEGYEAAYRTYTWSGYKDLQRAKEGWGSSDLLLGMAAGD